MVFAKGAVSRVLVSCIVISGSHVFFGPNVAAAMGANAATEAKAQTDRQLLLETACRSSHPVLVVDSFPPNADSRVFVGVREPNIDLDGDTVPDVFHGEFVEKIVQVSGHSTQRLDLNEVSSLSDLYEILLPVVVDIERGKTSYSRINLSQEKPLRLGAFKKDVFPDDPTVPEINAANVREYSEKILSKLWNDRPDFKLQELHDLFARLEKAGVPVIVAAGNFGPGFVNLLSMLPGTTTVGSLEVTGKKLFTSSDNAFVTEWKPGVVVPTAVSGGMDIDGDTRPEFLSTGLTGGPSVVEGWVGKRLSTSLSDVAADYVEWARKADASGTVVPNAAVNVIDPGLYRTEDLVALSTVTPGTRNLFRSLGTYALKVPGSPPRYFFEVTENGTLKFDPKRDGSANQRTRIGGTSFATPRICVGL